MGVDEPESCPMLEGAGVESHRERFRPPSAAPAAAVPLPIMGVEAIVI